MLTDEAKKEMEKQQYRIVGTHSAVKICGWTKKMIKGEGGCYKLKFYGIMSNQCLQMTTSISCANRCVFCWRGYKSPVSKEWRWNVDAPLDIMEGSIKEHHKLLAGLKGYKGVNMQAYIDSQNVKHVALSLVGEPIIYPRFNDLLSECHKQGISTFVVTNAQYPQAIRSMKPATQLYISLDAPNKELLKDIDKPLFSDYWERLNESLEIMSTLKYRTCIRLTAIKDLNMVEPINYAKLITKANPDFIEVKAYMLIGASRKRLTMENMPLHEEVVAFSKEINKHLPDYEMVAEHIPSRVVMFAKKSFKINDKWHTWIDFEKFNKLANSGENFCVEDYLRETPSPGISGKGTLDTVNEEKRKEIVGKRGIQYAFVDEKTPEIDLYDEP